MNKQELIDKLLNQLAMPSEIEGSEYDNGFDYATKLHLAWIAELYEPEKPVVPQFVADLYESIKDDFEDKVYDLYVQYHLEESELNSNVAEWFDNSKNKPIETLVKMKLFGYEVEKEKLYTVEIPNPNRTNVRLVLGLFNDDKVAILAVFADSWKYEKRYRLTEAEIKEDFEWAFRWAEEVNNNDD